MASDNTPNSTAMDTASPTTTKITIDDPNSYHDPLPSNLREGDHFLLHFADNRQLFAQALPRWKATKGCKINKRAYGTHNLIGLPYGTVLEVGRDSLIPLPEGEDLLPGAPETMDVLKSAATDKKQHDSSADDVANDGATNNSSDVNTNKDGSNNAAATNDKITTQHNDNRNLVDDNTSQKLSYEKVNKLQNDTSTHGSHIVAALISNSSTFGSKTAFSQAKYVKRKQLKYQPRCRIVRVTPSTLCSAMHLKDSRKICNLREDTLGQILSNANICAGQRVIVMDSAVQGIITASCTRRMGGYGSVISLHAAQQMPGYLDGVVHRMNFTIGEKQSLKWVSLGEVFGDYAEKERQTKSMCDENNGILLDVERRDREKIPWPAPLQPHTRDYMMNELKSDREIGEFLAKRSARFTRKLTRHSLLELRELVDSCRDPEENLDASLENGNDAKEKTEEMDTAMDDTGKNGENNNDVRQCDSLIIATKYDPTATLLRLFPYLAPSCPFVIYHEFLEPLLETFYTLQNYHATVSNDDENANTSAALNDDKAKPTPMMLRRNIAINLRLTDTWFREYQVLEGRTHPNMTMSQNGGYILMGTKLCPRTGTNELDEETLKAIRAKVGGRRTQHKGNKENKGDGVGKKKKRKNDRDGGDGKKNEKSGDEKRAKK